MMRIYEIGGVHYWFNEGEQPAGAVEVKADAPATEQPKAKQATTRNKTRKAETK